VEKDRNSLIAEGESVFPNTKTSKILFKFVNFVIVMFVVVSLHTDIAKLAQLNFVFQI
jgi:hypothetical protein